MEVGDVWAYRARRVDALEPVSVERLGTSKPARVLIRFVADEREGRQEWVPPARLKVPWADADAFVENERKWDAVMAHSPYNTPEVDAADVVYEQLIDPDVAELENSYRSGYLRIHNPGALAQWLGWQPDQLRAHDACFELGSDLIAPWPIAEAVAHAAARNHPQKILDYVIAEEATAARQAIHGYTLGLVRGHDLFIEPDDAARYDREHERPAREVLRAWCGARAVDEREELEALRVEIRRVGAVAERAVQALRAAGHTDQADRISAELGRTVEQLRES